MIDGAAPEVVRASNATHSTVLLRRTSARSRPPPHCTDEPEEVDRRVVLDPPAPLEVIDDRLYVHVTGWS